MVKKGGANTNINSSTTQSVKSPMGKIVFIIIIIILIVSIIVIISWVVSQSNKAKQENPVIINDVIDANVARPAFNVPEITSGMGQSFSTWIYVKDWNYKFGQYKWIAWKGNPAIDSNGSNNGNVHSPSLWLYPNTNSLKIVTSTSDSAGVESCDIPNIPLMTWVHIVYVLNNRTTDIYINGKLERSCALRGIPVLSADPVYITGGSPEAGFYGKMGKTQYFTKSLLPNDVVNLYQQGPLGSTQYQVQFFKDGKIIDVSSPTSFADDS